MKNILLLFTDQQRFDTIHALGNRIIKTPVLDKLVQEGVSFENAYTPCPVCVPARFSMHTGKMPHRTGIYENRKIPYGFHSFMEILSEHGYQSFGAGKMHFTFPSGVTECWGFDERKVCDEDKNLEKNDFYQDIKKKGFGYVHNYKGVRSEMYYIPQVSQLPEQLQHSAWTVDQCINYVNRMDNDRPFFIMAGFEKPHPPFQPPTPWNMIYRGADMPSPKQAENNEEFMTYWNHYQNRYKYRDQGKDFQLIRQLKAHYYAEISFVDYNVGRLLDSLEEKGVLDDTLIIYTSDHGEFLGDYNCYGKRSFLDSAARIPMIVKYPGCAKGSKCEQPVSLIDIMPTLLEYAQIQPEDDYDGTSLFSILEKKSDRSYVYGEYEEGAYASYMVTDGRFKYIYSVPDEKEFLFDHEIDPEELHNKAFLPLYTKKHKEMKQNLISYLKKSELKDAIEGDDFKRFDKKEIRPNADAHLLYQDATGSLPNMEQYMTDSNQKKYFEQFTFGRV